MTESEAIRARHAVRNYTTKPLSPAVIDGLKEEIDQCNRLGQLHIQLVTENGEAFKSMIPLFGRFKNVKNYIALAAKKQDGFMRSVATMERVSWLRLNKQVLTRVGSQIHTMRKNVLFR